MIQAREYTIAEIAVELGLPIEAVVNVKFLLAITPIRCDAAGMTFYNRRAFCLFHRLLIEKDGTALFERDDPKAFENYLRNTVPGFTGFDRVERTAQELAEDEAFIEAVLACDWERCEALMPPLN